MSVQYYRYNILEPRWSWPVWSTTFPGQDGCGSRVLSHIVRTPVTISQDEVDTYEPETIVAKWKTPSSASGRRSGYPPFHMTTYSIGTITKREHLVKLPTQVINGGYEWFQTGVVKKNPTTCQAVVAKQWSDGPNQCVYQEQTRSKSGLNVYNVSGILESEVAAAMNSVRAEVFAEANSSYDVLTDIAEMREVPRMVSDISGRLNDVLRGLIRKHGFDTMRNAYRLTPKQLLQSSWKQLRRLGVDWMTYRYGIMPLVYSYRDIKRTMNRGASMTTRRRKVITPTETGTSLPASSVRYLMTRDVGSVTVSGVVFQYFSSQALSRLSGLGINPLQTAWELIPYSFVIDWFVDIGSWIGANCGGSFATRKFACISRRENYTKETVMHVPGGSSSGSLANYMPKNWVGNEPPANNPRVIITPDTDQILEEEVHDTYSRYVVNTSYAPLSIQPSLNWRRLVDAAVMASNQLGRLLRSLR